MIAATHVNPEALFALGVIVILGLWMLCAWAGYRLAGNVGLMLGLCFGLLGLLIAALVGSNNRPTRHYHYYDGPPRRRRRR